jgi:hypothetical protein
MQDMQLVPAAKAKEGEKERTGGKFKRIKRDDKLPVGEKSTEKLHKKRTADDEEMELDGQGDVKRSKNGSSGEVLFVSDSVEAGLSEQPCGSQ